MRPVLKMSASRFIGAPIADPAYIALILTIRRAGGRRSYLYPAALYFPDGCHIR